MKNIIKLHWFYKYIDQATLWHSQLKDFEKKIKKKQQLLFTGRNELILHKLFL